MEMKSNVMMVDPALAAAWLAKNAQHNRPMRPTVVAGYAQQMQRGQWQLTHQGVAFDVNGILIDGQHRLSAVVQSNCIVPMMVTMNAPSVSFEALDCGIGRTIGDRLRMNPAVVALITATASIKGASRRRVDQHAVAEIHASRFGRVAELVISSARKTSTRRHMSNAWVAAAACVAIVEGQDPAFVIEQRRVLITQDEENETASAKSFRRRFQNLASSYDAHMGPELFACALRVFEYESRDIKVIKLVGDWRESARERATAALQSTNKGE